MNTLSIKWILVVGVTAAITTTATNAQEEAAQQTRVITLRNVDAITVVNAISELSVEGLSTVTSAKRVNKVIVQGEPSAVQIIVGIIQQLDAPSQAGGSGEALTTDLIPVGSYPLDDLDKLVRTALDLDGPTKVAVDEVNSRIVVTGTQKDIRSIRSLVEQLDRPRESYTVEFFFIRSLDDDTQHTGVVPLPKAMAPIALSLKQSGFGTLTLMAPLIIRVDDGGTFEQEASYTIRNPNGPDESLRLSISGDVQSAPDSEVFKIDLNATMAGVRKKTDSSDAHFYVNTKLSIPEGRYAVLAAAPASTRDGNAVALVIHVKSGSFE